MIGWSGEIQGISPFLQPSIIVGVGLYLMFFQFLQQSISVGVGLLFVFSGP